MEELLEAIAPESLLEWSLALVMIDKEQDIILCAILQLGIYYQLLWYIVSTLNVNWHTVAFAGNVVAQDVVLTSVSTKSNE